MCSCCCGCIKNFAIRIIYTIVIVALFVVLGLIPLDAMSAYGGFVGIDAIDSGADVCKNVTPKDPHIEDLAGGIYKIPWVKNGLTVFDSNESTFGQCAVYNPDQQNISGSIQVCKLNEKFTKYTAFGAQNISCFAYVNEDNKKLVKELTNVYLGSLGAIVALALVAVIAILCVFICCASWCKCDCCYLCKSCCLLKSG